MGWEEDIIINRDRLDYELMNQPMIFGKYGELLADAQDVRDRCKEKLDLTKSKIDYRIRSDPKAAGLAKATEASISNTILGDPEYLKANDEFMKAVHTVRVLEGGRNAVEQRKSMLVKLVDLWISGYWADPKVRKEAKDVFEQETQEGLRKSLDKRMLKRRKLGEEEC